MSQKHCPDCGRTIMQSYYTDDQGRADVAHAAACSPDVILSLLDRLERAEADAKRYRELRKHGGPGSKLHVRGDWSGYLGDYRHLFGEELDAAIDAAIRSQGGQQ